MADRLADVTAHRWGKHLHGLDDPIGVNEEAATNVHARRLVIDPVHRAPIYEKCQELDIIVSITSSLYLGPDLTYIEPARVQHIAADFPNLLIVLPHGGWPYTLEYLGLGLMYNNLWFMPDFYVYLPGIPGADLYVEAANSYLANRFLYASSFPSIPLKLALEYFTRLPFRPDVLENALYRNAKWILEERKQ